MQYAQDAKEAGRKARKEKMQRMFEATKERKADQIKELEETKQKIKEMDKLADDGLRPLDNKQKALKKMRFLEDEIHDVHDPVVIDIGGCPVLIASTLLLLCPARDDGFQI